MTLTEVVLLAAGAVALVVLVPRSFGPLRPPRAAARRRPHRRRRARTSPDLDAVERMLSMAVSRDEDAHVRLRPVVHDIATQRLADHAGVRLAATPETGPRLLGAETWDLIRPDRPRQRDRHARGIPMPALRAIVESLERIGARE